MRVSVGLVLVVPVLAGAWIAFSLRNEAAYDALMKLTAATASITRADEQDMRRLTEIETSWIASEVTTNTISERLTLAGLAPTVRSAVQVFTSPPPAYCWWPPSSNYRSMSLALYRSAYSELAGGRAIQVSDDMHVALLWLGTNRVLVFRDGPDGVLETWFKRKSQ